MFVKRVIAKNPGQAMPPDKLAFLQRAGRVSVLAARAPHVANCLRFSARTTLSAGCESTCAY